MNRLVIALLALTVPGAALAQALGGIDIQQQTLGSAKGLPSPVAQMSASDVTAYENGLRIGIAKVWESHGIALADDDISIASEIIPAGGGLKIVRSKVIVNDKSFQWVFMGVAGENLVGVFCTSKTAQPFEPGNTECGARVKQVFGGDAR